MATTTTEKNSKAVPANTSYGSAIMKKRLAGYGFLLPGFAFIALFMGYPLLYSLYLSFTEYNFSYDARPIWAGMQNFVKMFEDAYFIDALRNTAVFTVAFLPSLMILSLILALLLDKGVRGSGVFRTCVFLPVVVPLSLTGIVFQWILNEQYGLLNHFLSSIGLGAYAQNWLGDGKWAMVSIVVVSLWKNIGMLVILFMAGLQAISNDLYEAARVDGANALQRIFRITLPNLKESYIICGIWAIIQSVKVFEQPFIMTQGGPGTSTLVLYQYTWMNAFKYFDMGYASAIAYFMGVVILLLSCLNMFVNRAEDDAAAAGARKERKQWKKQRV